MVYGRACLERLVLTKTHQSLIPHGEFMDMVGNADPVQVPIWRKCDITPASDGHRPTHKRNTMAMQGGERKQHTAQ